MRHHARTLSRVYTNTSQAALQVSHLYNASVDTQVLPRYQRLAAELYERLRVVSLDEVLPALDNVLAAATGGGGRQQ